VRYLPDREDYSLQLRLKKRLYCAAALTMLAGLSSSILLYLAAGDEPAADMVDEFLNSKQYAHELAVYGGKLTLLADDFYRWFGSLWQGRQLAFTIAGITVAVSLGLFLVARSQPPGENPPAPPLG
jgi:hypothetical protein